MTSDDLKSEVLPLLMSGTRHAGSDQLTAFAREKDAAVLNALSLTGQALRFTRPPAPAEFAIESWPRDSRGIVPDRMRPRILRLLDKATDDTARALALALDGKKLRPHPFDLPRLDGFVRRYADRLGATAQYWVERETPVEQRRSYFEADELTVDTWSGAPLRARVRFLKELRKQDPKTGREILEKSWPSENPDSRVQLLATLETGLTDADWPFLEASRKDRAPRVRTIVERLLTVLQGSAGTSAALAAAMERIEKTTAGLLRKRTVLKLELPATVKEHEAARWIQEQFLDVNLGALARAYQLSEADLIKSVEDDPNLLFALALMASREGRLELLDRISDALPDAWGRMSEVGVDELEADRPDPQAWARAMVKPKKWLPQIPFPAWSWLYRRMEGPLPAGIMREVLDAKAWTEQLDEEKKGSAEFVQVICALCPRELRPVLRAQLEKLAAERRDKGAMLLEILDDLENLK